MGLSLMQRLFYQPEVKLRTYPLGRQAGTIMEELEEYLDFHNINLYQVGTRSVTLNYKLPSTHFKNIPLSEQNHVVDKMLRGFSYKISRYNTEHDKKKEVSILTDSEIYRIIQEIMSDIVTTRMVSEVYVGEPELNQRIEHVEYSPVIRYIDKVVEQPKDRVNKHFDFYLPIASNYG